MGFAGPVLNTALGSVFLVQGVQDLEPYSEEVTGPLRPEARLEVWNRPAYSIHDFTFTGMGMNTFRKCAGDFFDVEFGAR